MKGRFTESVAVHLLLKKNYNILEKNYYCIAGEVDIVVSKGQSVIFVEVKAWEYFVEDAISQVVSESKLRRLELCALCYLDEEHDCIEQHTGMYVRFDVILVNISQHKVVHYKGV